MRMNFHVWELTSRLKVILAIIDGVKKLTGARVSAPDLRAGAALVIAGLARDGINYC